MYEKLKEYWIKDKQENKVLNEKEGTQKIPKEKH